MSAQREVTPPPGQVTSVLRKLLDVTPKAPADADTDAIVAGIDEGIRARREVLDAAACNLTVSTAEQELLLAELDARRQSWAEALQQAQQQVGDQLIGARRARAYSKR